MMFYPERFRVSTPSDREIEVERDFDAPRRIVFDAFTKPELVRRWLLGPDGWTMPVCEIDLRVGGRYRYVWRRESAGTEMGMGGVFQDIVRPEKLVATEKFDESWYAGEAINTTRFEQNGKVTKVRLTVLYESREARDTASRSGMDQGMIAGYNRLEAMLDIFGEEKGNLRLIDVPEVMETAPQLAATIHLTVPRTEMRSVVGPGLHEIMTAVAAQGIGPAGPWFDHHRRIDPEVFDFEICVPVSAPVAEQGRVVGREIPALRVARTVYRGRYEELGAAWAEFDGWIRASGHTAGPDLYQCYAAGPESSPNPVDWKTELRRPLVGQS